MSLNLEHTSMYKLYLLTFLTSFIAASTFAQGVKEYHTLTNRAELLIIEGKYDSASANYQQAFRTGFPHFTRDYYNALLCAIELRDSALAVRYVGKILERNVGVDFFDQPHLRYLDSICDLDSLALRFPPRLNNALIDSINILLVRDQYVRQHNQPLDSVYKTDAKIYSAVMSILKQYGYPSETLVGVDMYGPKNIGSTIKDFNILLIHQLKAGHCEIMAYLEQSLEKGTLHPETFTYYAWYCDGAQKFGCFEFGQTVFIQIDSVIYTCSDMEETIINNYRKKYYLCDIKDLKKKIDFIFRKPAKKYKFRCNYASTYRELPEGQTNKTSVESLYEKNPGTVIFKKLNTNEVYYGF